MMITCAFCGDTTIDRGIWLNPSLHLPEQLPRVIRRYATDLHNCDVHILCEQCDQAMQDLLRYALNDVRPV